MGILKPIASTAGVLSATNYARMAVASMCIAGITIAMRAYVNIPLLRTVSTAPSTSVVNLTAITADGLDMNTVHIINTHTRQGAVLPAFGL